MKKTLVNSAFIDGNNLHRSALDIGWKLDTRKFRIHLEETYEVSKAYYCIGFSLVIKDYITGLKMKATN